MTPKTRSQTARSRPPNPSSLVTFEEELGNLHVEDDRTKPQRPTRPEAEGVETHTTPRSRKITKTVTSSQKDLARDADPEVFMTQLPFNNPKLLSHQNNSLVKMSGFGLTVHIAVNHGVWSLLKDQLKEV